MVRALSFLAAAFCLIVAFVVVGCWSSTGEVSNNASSVPFEASPMPDGSPPDQEPVRITKGKSKTANSTQSAEQDETPQN